MRKIFCPLSIRRAITLFTKPPRRRGKVPGSADLGKIRARSRIQTHLLQTQALPAWFTVSKILMLTRQHSREVNLRMIPQRRRRHPQQALQKITRQAVLHPLALAVNLVDLVMAARVLVMAATVLVTAATVLVTASQAADLVTASRAADLLQKTPLHSQPNQMIHKVRPLRLRAVLRSRPRRLQNRELASNRDARAGITSTHTLGVKRTTCKQEVPANPSEHTTWILLAMLSLYRHPWTSMHKASDFSASPLAWALERVPNRLMSTPTTTTP